MSLHPTPRSGAGSAREEPQQPDISDALAMEMVHAMRKRMRLKKKMEAGRTVGEGTACNGEKES